MDELLLYGGIGLGVVVFLVIIIIVTRQKSVKKNNNLKNNNSFKLMSYNVYENRGYSKIYPKDENCTKNVEDFINNLEYLSPFYIEEKPDIICTQEEPNYYMMLNDYNRLDICPEEGNTNENVAVYYHKNISNPPKFLGCIIDTNTTNPYTSTRHAIIFEYNNIKIANLHLDGGRFIDNTLRDIFRDYNKQGPSTIVLETGKISYIDAKQFIELLEKKLILLNKVIDEYDPDIIVGDFNSVYSTEQSQQKTFLEGQYEYYNYHEKPANGSPKKKIDDNSKAMIYRWNLKPYQILKEKDYEYAKPNNELDTVTNFRGNSIIDTIWYKKNSKYVMNNTQIIDTYNRGIKCAPSDHNPILTTVLTKSQIGRGKPQQNQAKKLQQSGGKKPKQSGGKKAKQSGGKKAKQSGGKKAKQSGRRKAKQSGGRKPQQNQAKKRQQNQARRQKKINNVLKRKVYSENYAFDENRIVNSNGVKKFTPKNNANELKEFIQKYRYNNNKKDSVNAAVKDLNELREAVNPYNKLESNIRNKSLKKERKRKEQKFINEKNVSTNDYVNVKLEQLEQ